MSFRNTHQTPTPVSIEGQQIEQVPTAMLLGVTLAGNLT